MSQIQRFFTVLFFAATLLIAGCSKSSTEAGLEKEDLDGDGIADIYDPDMDGDGIPNGSDPDIDGDGIPNDKDNDMDGDGKPNGKDPDIDGDGKPNEIDNTPIGDTWGPGTPGQCPGDASGTYPNCACPSGSQYNAQSNDCVADNPAGIGVEDPGIRYCDQIQVVGLNEEDTTGSEIVLTWYLQSSKAGGFCVVKDDVKVGLVQVTASAAGADETKSEQTNPVINTRTKIQIPAACAGGGGSVEVTYDFTEIADLIKADPNAPGWTVRQRHKEDPERCDTDGDLECTNVAINWPNQSVKLGESATITWSFTPEGCQLADENARLTLTVGDNTDPKFPTESVSAKATDWTATLTLPCATDRKRTLKYEMTGIDEAFGYETGVNWWTTGSHEAATSCPSEPPAPDDKICGVDNLSLFQDDGSYSTLEQQCATYFGAPARRVATLAETQCLCNAGEFSGAKTSFWTSTKDSDGKHWLVDKGSCTAFEVKDPTQSSTAPGLMAACVTD